MKERIPRLSEKEIQGAIMDFLRQNGFFVAEFAKPGGHFQLAGAVLPGYPDLIVVRDGEHIYFEVKTPKGNITLDQIWMHFQLKAAGCAVYVVRSVEDVQEALMKEGFEIRACLQ